MVSYEQTRKTAETEPINWQTSANEGAMRSKPHPTSSASPSLLRPKVNRPRAETFSSCKLNAFRELLYNALEGGHRMLVFSQFVKMLKILKAEVESAGLNFCYLDGSSKDRMSQVDRFQNDDHPSFSFH